MKKYLFIFIGAFFLFFAFNNFISFAFFPMRSSADICTLQVPDPNAVGGTCDTEPIARAKCPPGLPAFDGTCTERYLVNCMTNCYPRNPSSGVTWQDQTLNYCTQVRTRLCAGGGADCEAAFLIVQSQCMGDVNSLNNTQIDVCRAQATICKATTCTAHTAACTTVWNNLENAAGNCTTTIDTLSSSTTDITQAQRDQCHRDCAHAGTVLDAQCDSISVARADDAPENPDGGGEPEPPVAGDTEGATDAGDAMDPGAVDAGGVNGMGNTNMQQQFVSGLGAMPLPEYNAGSFNPVDFTNGFNADGDFRGAADMISSSSIGQGFNSNGITNDTQPFQKPMAGHGPTPKGNASPAQASGGSGGGGAGGMMGMGGAGGGRAAAPYRRRGGPLSDNNIKGMGVTYHAPSGAQGGTSKRNTASRQPLASNPRYNKTNSENAALARLFGARPAAYPASYSGCRDTVFCSMENFFQNQINRSTASEQPKK